MSKKKGIAGIARLLIATVLFTLLSVVLTGAFSAELNPGKVSICGSYPNISIINARVLNDNNYTVTNLVAYFSMNQSGLTGLTDNTHVIGSLDPYTYSTPFSWVYSCSDGPDRAFKVYLTLSSGEGNYSSQNTNYSLVNSYGRISTPPVSTPPIILNLSLIRRSPSDIELSARTDKDAICKFSNSNEGYDAMPAYMLGSLTNHSILLSLAQGTYSYYVLCRDLSGNVMVSPSAITFSLDSTGPSVGVHMDSTVFNSRQANFNVTTSEDATCELNMLYPGATRIPLPGTGLLHPASLTLEEGFYTWLVRCLDSSGNIGQNAFSLEIDLPPTAAIEIETNKSRLGAGVFNIRVSSSENLMSAPILKLAIQDQKKDIALAGSNRDWEGYMLIEKQPNDIVASFEITAVDVRGNVGHEILTGKSFIIDTSPPPAPQDIYAELVGDRVALRWYYTGEEVDHFNIFRSTQPYVGLANYLASSDMDRYYDPVNLSVEKYHYAVNTVDLAGNEGPLSKEISIVVHQEEKQQIEMGDGSVVQIFISNSSLQKIESLLSEVGKLKFDLQSANLGASGDEQLLRNQLGVQQKIDSAFSTTGTIENELRLLRLSRLKDFEIDARLQVYRSMMEKLESTPNKVEVMDKVDYIQPLNVNSEDLVSKLPLADSNKQKYLALLKSRLSGRDIERTLTTAKIIHLDGLEEYKTVIKDKINSQITDVTLLVTPAPAPEMTVLDETFKSLDKNTFEFTKKGLSVISYVVNDTLDREKTSEFYSFSIPDYNSFTPVEQPLLNTITGKISLQAGKLGLTLTEVVVIISGLAAIVLLLLYYRFFVKGKVPLFLRDRSLEELEKSTKEEMAELQRIAGKEPEDILPKAPARNVPPQKVEERESGNSVENKESLPASGKAESKLADTEGRSKEFEALIQQTESLFDSGTKEDILKMYAQLMKLYSGLPKEMKSKYYKLCIGIYTKLAGKK